MVCSLVVIATATLPSARKECFLKSLPELKTLDMLVPGEIKLAKVKTATAGRGPGDVGKLCWFLTFNFVGGDSSGDQPTRRFGRSP